MRAILLLVFLMTACVPASEPSYSHSPMFTIPFNRGTTLTVQEPTDLSVELHAATYKDVVAPQHGHVVDARVGSFTIAHWDSTATMIIDDIEVHWMKVGDEVCAGDTIGRTRHARVRAYWGWSEWSRDPDISIVRVIRNSTITDLSDMRVADQVHSALSSSSAERNSDVDRRDCPYEDGREEE